MRKVFVAVSGLLVLAVVAQFYFAAVGTFSLPQTDGSFSLHSFNANVIMGLGVLNGIAAVAARAGWRTALIAVLPTLLVLFQIVIFIVTGLFVPADVPLDAEGLPTELSGTPLYVIGLHAVNGLAVLAVAWTAYRRARRHAAAEPAAPSAPTPADAQDPAPTRQ